MGNRAVVVRMNKMNNNDECIYLHWNGGLDSVNGFIAYANEIGLKVNQDNFIDEFYKICSYVVDNSVYIERYGEADKNNYDNGVYIVDDVTDYETEKQYIKIVGRIYAPEQEQNEYKIDEFVEYIKECKREQEQPTCYKSLGYQLGKRLKEDYFEEDFEKYISYISTGCEYCNEREQVDLIRNYENFEIETTQSSSSISLKISKYYNNKEYHIANIHVTNYAVIDIVLRVWNEIYNEVVTSLKD